MQTADEMEKVSKSDSDSELMGGIFMQIIEPRETCPGRDLKPKITLISLK